MATKLSRKAVKLSEELNDRMAVTFTDNPGAAIDRLLRLRERQARAQSIVDKIKSERDALEEHVIGLLNKNKLTAGRGKLAQATIKQSIHPTVEDWAEFDRYVLRTGRLDLFQRRITSSAVRELWDEGEKIPGVTKFTKRELSLTKVRE